VKGLVTQNICNVKSWAKTDIAQCHTNKVNKIHTESMVSFVTAGPCWDRITDCGGHRMALHPTGSGGNQWQHC